MDYIPRAAFLPFHHRTQRWAIVVAHRRAGKTVACVADLITAGLSTTKPNPLFIYVAPFRGQAKAVAWRYLQEMARPFVADPDNDIRQSDLAVRLHNGAVIRLLGADNPNSLRGLSIAGVVLDEFADMKASTWSEVLRPALADQGGWAVFIGTPKGKNEFYRLWSEAQDDPNWYTLMLKASEAEDGVFPPGELEDARRTMPDSAYEAEFECSFTAAIQGAIYAKDLDKYGTQVRSVPYDASKLVNVAFDIGIGDSTAVWCWQHVGQEIRVLDYFESSGERITSYLSWLAARPYSYDTIFLPHDANNRQLTGLSVAEVVREAGFRSKVLPRLGLEEGINAARTILPRCWFDKDRCAVGLNALQHYRWALNDKMGLIKNTPVHDWASHGADAFRYLAIASKDSDRRGSMNGSGHSFTSKINYPHTRKW